MHHTLFVRGLECVGDLACDVERLFEWQRASTHEIPEGDALDQLHHEEVPAAVLLHLIQRCDVRMVEGGERLCFALESGDALRVVQERLWQDLGGDLATQLRVPRAVDFAHTAGTDGGDHFVVAEASPDR